MGVHRTVVFLASAAMFGCPNAVVAAESGSGATVTGHLSTASVVWVDDGNPPAPISTEMRNVDKSFVPDLLAIPVNSTVRFPNDDPFFHSIYSVSVPNDFDIGFYSTGPGKDEVFTAGGIVDVHCHIHARMHATIVIVTGPYEKADGTTFSLANVRSGTHVLYAWDAENGLRKLVIRVPRDGEFAVPGTI